MTHPNDMTQWDEIRCGRGHRSHDTITVDVDFGGHDSYPDYPSIPQRFRRQWQMEVWDWKKYSDQGPYCPGHDVVSEVIHDLGVWEPGESAVLSLAFEDCPGGVFYDFGCQIGWYSTMALTAGIVVYAYDADDECVDLAWSNMSRNAPLLTRFGVYRERFDANTGCMPFDGSEVGDVIVKIDVEGAEVHALAYIQPAIDLGLVKYMLIEISPVFNDSYPALVQGLLDDGFIGYEVPPRRDPPPYPLERLSDLEPFRLSDEQIAAIPSLHQANWLFVLGGL
jgi:hypothetical protein